MSRTSQPDIRGERWTRVAIVSWAVVGLLVLFAALMWLLGRLSAAITPLVLALVIVFFLKGMVNWFTDRGVNRILAVAASYLIGIIVVSVFMTVIIPPLGGQVGEFIDKFPTYYDEAYQLWQDVAERYEAVTVPVWIEDAANSAKDEVVSQVGQWSRRTASGVFAAGSQAVGFFVNLVLSVVIAFYVLKDLPRLRESALRIVPDRRRAEARHLYCTVVRAIGGYIRGQLIISLIVGVLTTIGMWIAGVPFPLVIGLITGVFNIVPYLGPVIGGVVAAISGAFVSPTLAIVAAAVVIGVQQVDGWFISPRIMSDQVDLHPVAVIISLLVGGTLLGFTGLLVAIPLAAAGKGVAVYYMEEHGARVVPESAPSRRRRRSAVPWARKVARDDGEEDAGTDEESQ